MSFINIFFVLQIMASTILPFLILIWLTNGNSMIVRENVIFEQSHEISTTRSRWLVTMVIDLSVYDQSIDKLYSALDEVNRINNVLVKFYDVPLKDKYFQTFKGLELEIINLRTAQDAVYNNFQILSPLHDLTGYRRRRSLLPIIGKAFSFLFGTVSEDDLQGIRNNINNLANNQRKITHVIQESLTLINGTRLAVRENRQKMNEILGALVTLSDQLKNLTTGIEKQLHKLDYFVNSYLRINRAVQEIQVMTSEVRTHVEHLYIQLNALAIGHLTPSIMAPHDLKDLLLTIKTKLPRTLRLPGNPDEDLWSFYKFLTCTSTTADNKLLIILSIPLLDAQETYHVYKIHNIPALMTNQSNSVITNGCSMVAQYKLESNAIAINTERTQYMLLSNEELKSCSNPLMGFCFARSPVYKTSISRLCVTALFLQEVQKVRKYCKVIVQLKSVLPRATYLNNGHWVVSTSEKLHFVKLCGEGKNTLATDVIVRPPIQIVTLDQSCSAVTSAMTLPPHYHQESKYNATNLLTTFMQSYNVSAIQLWKPVHSNFDNLNNISIPEKLNDLEMVSMDKLVEELKLVNSVPPLFDFWGLPTWAYVLMGVASAIIIIVIIFVYCKIKRRWSGKLWRKQGRGSDKGENGEGFPLVMINSSGDVDAGRGSKPSAPMVTSVYSTGTDDPDAIRKMYPTIIGEYERTKGDN